MMFRLLALPWLDGLLRYTPLRIVVVWSCAKGFSMTSYCAAAPHMD